MKDWLVGLLLGVIIGGLIVFIFLSKSTYTDQEILITVTKWEERLIDRPYPVYITETDTVPIADTTQFGNIPLTPFHAETDIPFSVNDSLFGMRVEADGEVQGWLKSLDLSTQEMHFLYEVKLKKQVDWKWCFLAFAVGALSMRAVDAMTD